MLCIDFDSALSQCPFTSLLLTQLDEVTAKGFKKECAELGLAVMFHVLSSFDDDYRLQDPFIREKIAVMFWPFVRVCLRFVHNMISHTLSSESWHYLLSCFIFVVGNIPTGFLSKWCSTQSFRIISYFVQILHRAIKEFSTDTHMYGVLYLFFRSAFFLILIKFDALTGWANRIRKGMLQQDLVIQEVRIS
jgi:hypothetical protein